MTSRRHKTPFSTPALIAGNDERSLSLRYKTMNIIIKYNIGTYYHDIDAQAQRIKFFSCNYLKIVQYVLHVTPDDDLYVPILYYYYYYRYKREKATSQ